MFRGEGSGAKILRPRLSDSISDSVQEESSPWMSLPSDIVERTLALLPLPDVFRLRAVCKRWNAVIHCAQFQEMSLRCPVSWGPFYSPRVGWKGKGSPVVPWSSYDLAERKWIPMPQLEFPLLNRNTGWNLMAANGGLFCFRASDGRRILVCNPMTNRWKELPSGRLDSRLVTISYMIVDEQRSSYKILFAGNVKNLRMITVTIGRPLNEPRGRLYIRCCLEGPETGNAAYKWPDPRCGMVDSYDSIANTWSPAENLLTGRVIKSGAYCSGEFYVLTQEFPMGPYAVGMLDLTTLRWRDKTIPVPEGFEIFPYIVECSGCVYLVGGSGQGTFSLPINGIGVFQLDPSNLSRWIKVSEYTEKDFGYAGAIYGCGSNGSKIYVVIYLRVAVYDCATGVWEEIFKGNLPDMKEIAETKFIFQPNLRVAP